MARTNNTLQSPYPRPCNCSAKVGENHKLSVFVLFACQVNMGDPLGKTGNIFGNTGDPLGKTGNIFGNTGDPLGKTGNVFGNTGDPLGNT